MRARQARQRPRNHIHASTGTLSYARTDALHVGQWDPGVTSDSPRGSRYTMTLRKDPSVAPSSAARMIGMAFMASSRCDIGRPTARPQREQRGGELAAPRTE